LRRMIARAVRRRTLAEWLNVLDRRSIPVAPVLTVPEALADPQLAGRQTHIMSGDASDASLLACAPPALVARQLRPAPDLGADTDHVLASLGDNTANAG
jgi:crotonobetainyl-CoA:carnitine CoA-transferase CaiB-like acyl-CoA transferase